MADFPKYAPTLTTQIVARIQSAKLKAFQSFMRGLLVDVSAFVITVLITAFTDIKWTKEYWIALAGLLGKTILQASAAYIARRFYPQSLLGKH